MEKNSFLFLGYLCNSSSNVLKPLFIFLAYALIYILPFVPPFKFASQNFEKVTNPSQTVEMSDMPLFDRNPIQVTGHTFTDTTIRIIDMTEDYDIHLSHTSNSSRYTETNLQDLLYYE